MEELNHHRALAGEYVGTLTNHTTPPPVRPSCLVISKRRGRYYFDPIPKRSGGHRSMLPPAGSVACRPSTIRGGPHEAAAGEGHRLEGRDRTDGRTAGPGRGSFSASRTLAANSGRRAASSPVCSSRRASRRSSGVTCEIWTTTFFLQVQAGSDATQ
jgi:hypothetical protein